MQKMAGRGAHTTVSRLYPDRQYGSRINLKPQKLNYKTAMKTIDKKSLENTFRLVETGV